MKKSNSELLDLVDNAIEQLQKRLDTIRKKWKGEGCLSSEAMNAADQLAADCGLLTGYALVLSLRVKGIEHE